MKIDDKYACFSMREKNHEELYLSVQCLEQPNEFGRHIDTLSFVLYLWKFFSFYL